MSEKEKGFFVSVIKGAFAAVICALVFILLFAAVINWTELSSSVIKPVNQFIKAISVFIGCFLALNGRAGLIKGAILGLIFTVLVYLVFALVSNSAVFSAAFFLDLLFGVIVGAISGILTVNFRK